jgi:hypothetical protein
MAYAFKRIDDVLNKANIFSGKNTDDETSSESQPSASPTMSSSSSSSSTSQPQLSNSGSSSMTSQPESAPAAVRSGVSAQTRTSSGLGLQSSNPSQIALQAAQKRGVEIPGLFGKVSQSLEQKQADMRRRADEYLQNQRRAAEDASRATDDQIGSAASSGDSSDPYKRIRDILSNNAPRPPEAINLPTAEELARDTAAARDVLGSDASMAKALTRGRGFEYTPQIAEFDVQAIRGAPGFQRTLKSLGEDYKKLGELSKSLGIEMPAKAAEEAKNILKANQDSIRDRLNKGLISIRQANDLEAKSFEDYYNNIEGLPSGMQDQLEREIQAEFMSRFGTGLGLPILSNLRGRYFNNVNFYEPFLSDAYRNTELPNANDLYSRDEASKFSNLSRLLDPSSAGMSEGRYGNITPEKLYGIDQLPYKYLQIKDKARRNAITDINFARKKEFYDRADKGEVSSTWKIPQEVKNAIPDDEERFIDISQLKKLGMSTEQINEIKEEWTPYVDLKKHFEKVFDAIDKGKILSRFMDKDRVVRDNSLYLDDDLRGVFGGRSPNVNEIMKNNGLNDYINYLQSGG